MITRCSDPQRCGGVCVAGIRCVAWPRATLILTPKPEKISNENREESAKKSAKGVKGTRFRNARRVPFGQ